MSIQTYNVENLVFDSDERTARLGREYFSRESFWLQSNNPVQVPGDHINDEDVGAALVSDSTPTGVDIDGDQVSTLVLCQPRTLGQVDLDGVSGDLAQWQKVLVIHLDSLAVDDNNFLPILPDQKIPGKDRWRELGEYFTLVAVSDEFLAEETNEGTVMENVQLGHRDFEILDLQIVGDNNRLTTSRIFPNQRRQVQVFLLLLLLTWSDGLRLGLLGGGAEDWLPEAALHRLTERNQMIVGADVRFGTFPAGVTLGDLLVIRFAIKQAAN